MKLKMIVMTALLAVGAFAADATGKWTAEVAGRGGQTRTTNMEFKVDGSTLTGSMAGMNGQSTPITEGKVDGDKISFKVVREFNGNTMTSVYHGKISGDEIKFSMTMEGRDGPAREFTAKRAN
jgi:hypothetical protein